jgi:hypothetical protein
MVKSLYETTCLYTSSMSHRSPEERGKVALNVEINKSEFGEFADYANSQGFSLASFIVKLLRESRTKYGIREDV